MDDESAEIELLEQNLNKTRQISQRMTSILTSFDSRLIKLEKSILPLYNSTQILNRRANNIEKALVKIDELASNQEGIAAEEALILRGPQPGQLDVYQDTLERLNAAIAFKTMDRDARDTARLIETGAKKLVQLYTKLVAEASSGPLPVTGPLTPTPPTPAPFPSSLLATLQPLVLFLRTLPTPTTHPSHPAASAIWTTLKEAQKGYAEMRGGWVKKGLEVYGRRCLDRAETVEGVVGGREVGGFVEGVLGVAEDEWTLLTSLSPLPTSQTLSQTYTTLLTPLLTLLTNTLTSLTSLIKRSLHKYTFLALAAFESLGRLQGRWEEVLKRRRGDSISTTITNSGTGGNVGTGDELKDGLAALRAVCLRSFPEFLADVKVAAMSKGGDTSTGLADFTLTTVNYVERIPEVEEAVGSVLLSLGDGNWRMGDRMPVAKSNLGPGDEQIVIEHFMYDVINTVITSLTTISKTQKRPAFGSIFLLNNISYLRMHVLLEPRTQNLPRLLSRQTQDTLNSNFRTAKAEYFNANFMPLLQTLSDETGGGAGGGGGGIGGIGGGGAKAATKERFTKFFDLFEEVAERHRMARVLEDDIEGKDTIVEEVVKLVVPTLQRFTQKNREKEFSKNPQKYIKMSADEVESQIRSFYR